MATTTSTRKNSLIKNIKSNNNKKTEGDFLFKKGRSKKDQY
jgi:hypothetical protein